MVHSKGICHTITSIEQSTKEWIKTKSNVKHPAFIKYTDSLKFCLQIIIQKIAEITINVCKLLASIHLYFELLFLYHWYVHITPKINTTFYFHLFNSFTYITVWFDDLYVLLIHISRFWNTFILIIASIFKHA